MRRLSALLGAVALGATLLLAPSAAVAADDADDILVTIPERGPVTGDAISDAQFRWGLNPESGAGAFAGGCNFLSAGRAGDIGGGGRFWTQSHGFHRATDGNVRVVKPNASGEYSLVTWADKCLDPAGSPVSVGSVTSTSGNQIVIDGGTGVRGADGSVEIRWTGAFTVAFYGGMSYWSATNPVLTLDASGNGRVTAIASGYGASMEDLTKWERLPEREVVLAEIRGASSRSAAGFATTPLYVGVALAGSGQVAQDATNAPYWGAFPASFVEYQKLTGLAGYWVTTGGVRDRAKPPTTLYISYDADAPITVTPPVADSGGGATPNNTIRTRPVAAAAAAVAAPAAPSAPTYPLATTTTALPIGEGLIPGGLGAASNPLLLPLLGTAAALSLAILAVLNLMQVLPWQRPSP